MIKKELHQRLVNLFYPSKGILFSIPLVSFASCFLALLNKENGWVQHLVYVVSAYSLLIIILTITKQIKMAKSPQKSHSKSIFAKKLALIKQSLSKKENQIWIALISGTISTFVFGTVQLIGCFVHFDSWPLSLGLYYYFLSFLRGGLLANHLRRKDERMTYRWMGFLLLILSIPLLGMTLLMIKNNNGFVYQGTLIYAMAFIDFYLIVSSAIGYVRFYRDRCPVVSASKTLSLISSSVSLLWLQTAMFASFSPNDASFRYIMNLISGTVVFLFVFFLAIKAIVRSYSKKEIHQ